MSNTLEIKQLIENHVIPLFGGAYFERFEESTPAHKCVATAGGNKSLLVKLERDDTNRMVISRAQPFTPDDRLLMDSIIHEFSDVQKLNISEVYKESLLKSALENAISKNLSTSDNDIISRLISKCAEWSERTYEGGRVSFGFVVNFDEDADIASDSAQLINIEAILDNDFAAVLSDGVSSWIEIDKKGLILSHHVATSSFSNKLYCPRSFSGIADFVTENKIGIVLLSNGEILLLKDKELKFAKRRGSWRSFHHKAAITQMKAKSNWLENTLIESIYLTSLDVSFGRSGGCICHTRKTMEAQIYKNEIVNTDDLTEKSLTCKSSTVNKIVEGRSLNEMDRKLRQELLGIDGATILNYEGRVIAAGAIISIKSGSSGGGRTAATKELSNYGVAVKISEDGLITGYYKTEMLFSIG